MRAVNLIPSEQRAGSGSLAGRSGGAALIVLGLLVGVAVLAVMYGGAARQISKESGEVAKLEAQTAEVRARTGRLTPYTAFVAMAEQRTKTVAQLVQARFDWSHTLHELGRVLPGDSSLLTLQGTVGSAGTTSARPAAATASAPPASSATPASSTPPGSTPTIALTGCSTSQAEVAQTLQRLRLIDGVSEVHLLSATKGAVSGAGASGGCGAHVAFSITVTFAALPATPIPNVAAPTVPASTAAAKGAHAEPVSAHAKGARR
jgi:Tfp pilus assembly protein PilN